MSTSCHGSSIKEQSVLSGIVTENISEPCGDHRLESVAHEGPWRVFAGGAAAEVLVREQYLRTLEFRSVQHKIRLRGDAVLLPAQVLEEVVAEALFIGRFQVAGGNDLVGVDIVELQRSHPRRKIFEFRKCHGE